MLLGDPEGLAPGWIFGRGDCGYKGGKSLPEIMVCKIMVHKARTNFDLASLQNFFQSKQFVNLFHGF